MWDAGTASISRDASVIGSNSAGGVVAAESGADETPIADVASGLLREGVGDFIRGGHDDSYDGDTIRGTSRAARAARSSRKSPGSRAWKGSPRTGQRRAGRGRFGEPVGRLGVEFDRDYGEPGDDDYEYDYDYRDYALLGARRDVGASGGASPGVPGFANRVRAKSGSATRIVVSVKPGNGPWRRFSSIPSDRGRPVSFRTSPC